MEWWSIKLQSVSHHLRDRRGDDRLVRHRNALLRNAKEHLGLPNRKDVKSSMCGPHFCSMKITQDVRD